MTGRDASSTSPGGRRPELVPFGTTELRVSRVCQGTAFRNMPRMPDNVAGQRVLEHCIDVGVNFFDSSNAYGWGGSEELLGKAVAGRRDRVVICTKVAPSYAPKVERSRGEPPRRPGEPAHFTRDYLFQQAEASLRRLGTDYIDLYLLHQPDGETPAAEIADSMDALVRSGKIRYWGVSNHSKEQLGEYTALTGTSGRSSIAGIEDYYNMAGLALDQDGASQVRRLEREVFPLLRDARLGLLSFSTHDQGHLVPGKTAEAGSPLAALLEVLERVAVELSVPRSQVCVAWVLAHPEVTSALAAAETPEHVDDNLAGARLELPADVMDTLNAASVAFSDLQQVQRRTAR